MEENEYHARLVPGPSWPLPLAKSPELIPMPSIPLSLNYTFVL